jgi:hypothetical protein
VWLQAIRRSAERAFLELGLKDYARFDGWLMLHSEAQHMEFLADHVERVDNPTPVPSARELPLPGFGPLPEDEYLYENVFDMTEVRSGASAAHPRHCALSAPALACAPSSLLARL